MGTVEKYRTPGGIEGYLARDSWRDVASGERRYKKARFQASKHGGLKRAKAEADAWLAQREAARSRGVIWEPSRETLGALLDRWSASLGPPLAGSTIVAYQGAARKRFDAKARALVVGEVTRADVRAIVARWEREAKAYGTRRLGWVVLRKALGLALDEGGIQADPSAGVDGPKGASKEGAAWSALQVRVFLDKTAGDDLGYVWRVLFDTGCRIGELCALRWDDFDLTRQAVTISRTWGRSADGRRVLQEFTKTKQVRMVPLPPGLVAELRPMKRDGWFVEDGSGPMSPERLARAWSDAVRRAGLPRLTPHGARHSSATNMLAAGVPFPDVGHVLGHAELATTLRYLHANDTRAVDAVAALHGLYRGELEPSGDQSAPKMVELKKKAR